MRRRRRRERRAGGGRDYWNYYCGGADQIMLEEFWRAAPNISPLSHDADLDRKPAPLTESDKYIPDDPFASLST